MNDKELDKLLDQWQAPDTPPWLKTKVMQAVREEAAQDQSVLARWWHKLALPQIKIAAAIAAVIILLSLVVLQNTEEATTEMVALEDALNSFASFTNEETSWGEDPFL